MQDKSFTFTVKEYYSGRTRSGSISLSEEEVATLIHFLREEDHETSIYNSELEKLHPRLYHKLDEAAVPLMDELEAELTEPVADENQYQAGIPEDIVRMAFESGLKYTSSLYVTEDDTAQAMGSGTLPVLATPRLAALMENAAMLAVAPILEPGETTVGGEISLRHLAPSPIGAGVSATATLEMTEGRKLLFSIEARQGETLIGTATHTRFIVNTTRFLKKLDA